MQGRKYCGEALHLNRAEHCRIEDNHFYAVGGNAAYLQGFNARNVIRYNFIADSLLQRASNVSTRQRPGIEGTDTAADPTFTGSGQSAASIASLKLAPSHVTATIAGRIVLAPGFRLMCRSLSTATITSVILRFLPTRRYSFSLLSKSRSTSS